MPALRTAIDTLVWLTHQAYPVDRNLETAKALGLTIPPPVLLRADRVIE